MKKVAIRISDLLRIVFGYGIMICLFAGGVTFLGYIAALCTGGDVARVICEFIYKRVFPIIIKSSTILVLVGLVSMYLKGETALTASADKEKKNNAMTI